MARARRMALSFGQQPDRALANAQHGLSVGHAIRGERSERRLDRAARSLPRDLVNLRKEARNEESDRLAIKVLGASDLNDAAGAHDRNTIAETHGFLGMMRHDHARRARLSQELERTFLQALAELDVKARERLVHEHDGRARDERTGKRDALLLPARENVRMLVCVMLEADTREKRQCLAPRFRRGKLLQPKRDILHDREMRKEREVLEHEPDVAFFRRHETLRAGHFLVVDEHAPARRPLDAGSNAEQCRLSAARRP